MRRLIAGLGLLVAGRLCVAADCADLARPGLFGSTEVRSRSVAADAATGAPAHCELTAVIRPVPGSQITAVYRLPEEWNGRMLGLGGGGWAGNVLLATALPALKRGYATAQTDGGHPGTNGADTAWTKDPVAVTDFSHRAVHETAVLGKQVVARRYGRDARRNYFQGCSTGGRMGLMETQRYPDDYEGVIAGAPVYSLLVQTSPVVRRQIFAAPGAALTPALLTRVNDAAVAACDAADGVKDGVVTDPRRCGWDPAELSCKAGATGDCLTQPQVTALRQAYETRRTKRGVVGNYGMTRGGEAGWGRFVAATTGVEPNAMNGGLGDLIPLIFSNQAYDAATFDVERQQALVHRTPFASEYEAVSTDLSGFRKRGGKLLLWHGWDDPGPSPFATIDYFERARRANGAGSVQLFIAPGVYHCGGGPGADEFDLLTAMENWVEKGMKPQRLVARNRKTGDTRPLCAWPGLPYFSGKGDAKDERNFACRAAP
jgi:feruloyl esterase